ncbi:MAG: homoserine dehydrogenase, partial [Clostridiales bacterium]|nr:homoserine dehydrogenase [Clostridiales bacterium]
MTKVKELNVALLGLGTVGKGLVNLLNENKDEILNKHNAKVNIVKVYERNADKLEKFGMDRALFTDNMQ